MKKQLTKQELRDKQEKKQRILKFVKRAINIVCYCLSVLFLILCVAVGVNSCSSSKDKTSKLIKRDNYIQNVLASNGVDLDDYDVYESLFSDNGLHNLSVTLQQSLTSAIDLSSLYTDGAVSSDYRENYYPSNSYILYNGELSQITRIQIRFSTYTYSTDETRVAYRLNSINIFAPSNIVYASKDDSAVGDYYAYDNTYYITSLTSGYSTQFIFEQDDANPLLNTFFIQCEPLDFTFNNIINYNGYFNASLNSPYIQYSTLSVDIDLPMFISGGNLYNRIHLQFIDAYGQYYVDNSGTIFELNAYQNTFMTYNYMQYENTTTGLSTMVNMRDHGVDYAGASGTSLYLLNTSSWVSTNYTILKFVDEPDNDLINTLTKFNSNTTNINTGSKYTDVGLGNVFSLLSTSFSALISLFTIQIIPGLTIGILLFLPLVVTIIILVFKAVKK